MHFEIPHEFRNTPEAIKLHDIDAEFTQACEAEVAAVNARLWEADLSAFTTLNTRVHELQMAMKGAREAFDKATGEPKPVDLPSDVLGVINEQFDDTHQLEVIALLAKTLAYLQRQQVHDTRVMHCILKLAKGDIKLVAEYAGQARRDYRDVILAAIPNPTMEQHPLGPARCSGRKPSLKALFNEVDFHVLYMIILLLALILFLPSRPWLLVIPAVIPQGRILTRALLDYPRFKRPAAKYLMVNEAVVVAAVAACLMLWWAMNWI